MKQSTSTLFCRSAALLLVSAVVSAAGCDVEAPTKVEPTHPSNEDVIGKDVGYAADSRCCGPQQVDRFS